MPLDWPLMDNNLTQGDMDAVCTFLQDGPRLTQGENVKAFEAEWSAWLGCEYSLFVNSGASANFITLGVLKHLYGGGQIILPPLTWISDVVSVLQWGFEPVFVDIDPRTLGMDPAQVLAALTDETRAVFLTHVQGFDGITDELLRALEERRVHLIEDVCESHGATHGGRKLGSFGLASNFSFYYAHHMSTVEGGMVCTNDPAFYQAARMFRSHGMVREATDEAIREQYRTDYPDLNPDFIFAYPALNMRNTEIGAVFGRNQLPRLDEGVALRTRNLMTFLDHLDGERYQVDFLRAGSSNYALNLILKEPDPELQQRVEAALRRENVEFRRGSAGGGNQLRQPYLRARFPDLDPTAFPRTEHVHFYGCYLGNYPTLPEAKIHALCELLNEL